MNIDDPIDLSALDPMREAARWEGVVNATVLRVNEVIARRERTQDPLTLIASWRKPVLLAAAVAMAILIPVELLLEVREDGAEQVERLVTLSSALGTTESAPSGADFLQALEPETLP